MKPAIFDYHQPDSIAQVLDLLKKYQGNAKIIAGGQSLAPMINMRMAHMQALIDIHQLSELSFIQDRNNALEVGSLTTHHAVATSVLVQKNCPLLSYAASTIGHYVIRQRGTIGGSLCHADPAAQMPLIALTLGANFHIKGLENNRIVSAEDFYLGAMTSCLAEDEFLAGISYPIISPETKWTFELFNRRHGDYAIVSVALCVDYDKDHHVKNIRIGLNGTADFAKDYSKECQPYLNHKYTKDWLDDLCNHLIKQFTPFDDERISATYRLELAKKLIQNAFQRTYHLFNQAGK